MKMSFLNWVVHGKDIKKVGLATNSTSFPNHFTPSLGLLFLINYYTCFLFSNFENLTSSSNP